MPVEIKDVENILSKINPFLESYAERERVLLKKPEVETGEVPRFLTYRFYDCFLGKGLPPQPEKDCIGTLSIYPEKNKVNISTYIRENIYTQKNYEGILNGAKTEVISKLGWLMSDSN